MTNEGRTTRSIARAAVQLVGFGVGIALLWWCVKLALSEENREAFARLRDASTIDASALLALSVGTILVNGLVWWALIHPVRRLDLVGVSCVNAIATLLSYLPFKLSVLARIAIHKRRDGLPIMTIGAWLAAFGALVIITLGAPVAVTLLHAEVDALWWAGSAGLFVLGIGALIALSRVFAGPRGTERVLAIARFTRIGLIIRLVRTTAYANLHDAFNMTGNPSGVLAGSALRVADLGIQAARFYVAAKILGIELSPEAALVTAVAYFAIGVISPFGVVGTREGGATLIAGSLAGGSEQLAAITLVVTGSEAIAALATGAISIAWLRPWKLLGKTEAGGNGQ